METQIAADPKDVDRYKVFLKLGSPGPHAYTVLLGLEYFDLPNVASHRKLIGSIYLLSLPYQEYGLPVLLYYADKLA